MEAVVAPLLHKIVPPAGIERVELPQLLTTVTAGVAGVAFGAAAPEPAALIHPLTVLVTVYVPGVVTLMEAVVAPLLHRIVPPAGIDRVELPQLLTTVTTGVAGVAFGAATPDPAALVQPLTVLVTVYVPGVVTLIEAVVAPLLHRIVPPAGIDRVELPQLLTTVTTGVTVEPGAATPDPAALVHPLTVLVTV